ncbi:lipoate--protein ligase family protein, partial [Halorubrum pallidum]
DALTAWVTAGTDEAGGTDEYIDIDRDGSWTDAELRRAADLAEAKYRDPEWVRTRPGSEREE